MFGNYATLAIDVDGDELVATLKQTLQNRLRIDVRYQQLKVKNYATL